MTAPLLQLDGLTVAFRSGSRALARLRGRPASSLTAVDAVSLEVERGASLGIVGESGCGKSTLAKALVGLVPVTSGTITFDGRPLTGRRDRATQRRVQMVFQDPSSALNPSRTVGQTLTELLKVHRMVPADTIQARARELLELVELPASLLNAYPRRLSGGQRQRVGIARALALNPEVLIADESVAALDVSVQASVLNLMARLREELGITLLFISHDLAVVRHISERTVVMYLGRIVEDRPTRDIFTDPRHPYTVALLRAAPRLGTKKDPGSAALPGEPPAFGELPSGCRFHPRCPQVRDICRTAGPDLIGPTYSQKAACHFAWTARDPATYPDLSQPVLEIGLQRTDAATIEEGPS